MVRWVVEMYIEVASDYKFMRCSGSNREKGGEAVSGRGARLLIQRNGDRLLPVSLDMWDGNDHGPIDTADCGQCGAEAQKKIAKIYAVHQCSLSWRLLCGQLGNLVLCLCTGMG